MGVRRFRQGDQHEHETETRRAGQAKKRNLCAQMFDQETGNGRAERCSGRHCKPHEAHGEVKPAAAMRDVGDNQRDHHANGRGANSVEYPGTG